MRQQVIKCSQQRLTPKIQGTYLCTHKMENQTWYTKVMQKMLCIAFTVYDVNPEINLKKTRNSSK